MPASLQTPAVKRSTYGIRAAFTNEAGVAAVPNVGTLTWTLTDLAGNVVNLRSAVAITSAAIITIVLHGADLALGGLLQGSTRVVTIQGLYNSDLGTNLELKEQVEFEIADLLIVVN